MTRDPGWGNVRAVPMNVSPPLSTRRRFLRGGALVASAWVAAPALLLGQAPPSRRVRVGVMGLRRGKAHVAGYLAQPGVEVAWLCDVDRRSLEEVAGGVEKKQGRAPRITRDFRHLLDDPELDAVSIAAPNHWHTPATLMACAAGKHVYVEKPGSHNLQEAGWIVAAAREHRRLVQMGNQRRSWPHVREAMDRLHSGAIGPLRFVRSWYAASRGSIGRGRPSPVPEWLDYDLWQGPAPDRAYRDNVVHYDWHWRWHWGGGELANNGIHALDLVRWGLRADHPATVSCTGGRFHFDDDQETPDTQVVTYGFGGAVAVWEGHSCEPQGLEGVGFGVTFQGENGSLVLLDRGWRQTDAKNKTVAEGAGQWDDTRHFANFIGAIRNGETLTSEIDEAQKSTRLCHLGNIAWRSGSLLAVDPSDGSIRDADERIRGLIGREYRPGWQPRVGG